MRAADAALAQAAATDRGWHARPWRAAARLRADRDAPRLVATRPHLVLVDDRPGIEEDRAHFVAVGEGGDEARVVLARQGDLWFAERVD